MSGPLSGTVEIPVIGKSPKWAVYGVGAVAVVYVGYRWWSASTAGYEEIPPDDPGYASGSTVLPAVEDAYSDNNFGIPSGEPPSTSDFGFRGTDNDEWSQYVITWLTQSAEWNFTEISKAIGRYLSRQTLTSSQVEIVQAAIAAAGYPPQGSYTIKRSGGGAENPVLVAPDNVRVVRTGQTYVTIRWSQVAGADNYRVYVGGEYAEMGGTDLVSRVDGLSPGTQYQLSVTAIGQAGQEGPHSAAVSATTDAAAADPEPDSRRHRTMRITRTGQTLSELVADYNRKHGTSHTWQEIYAYNLRNRSKATRRKLRNRRRGNYVKVYRGTSFWFPY